MINEYLGTTLTIRMEEYLVSTIAAQTLEDWKKWLKEYSDATEVILDLSGARIIDSEGINLIIGLYRECTASEKEFRVEHASQDNIRLFKILKLSKVFGLQPA